MGILKNIFSVFTKKGKTKGDSKFIGKSGKDEQTDTYKKFLKAIERMSNLETLNKHSKVVGRTDNGLSRWFE